MIALPVVKKAAVIGAGPGGLALAIRLQRAGIETVLLEKNDRPGGRALGLERDGFVFESGTGLTLCPDELQQLWSLCGKTMSDHVTLEQKHPCFRLGWPDGKQFDYSIQIDKMRAEIRRFSPDDLDGFERYLAWCQQLYDQLADLRNGDASFDISSAIRVAPQLVRFRAWRSAYKLISSFIGNDQLRQALCVHILLSGVNPMTGNALHCLAQEQERREGAWYVEGGSGKLFTQLLALFEEAGGQFRPGDPVCRIETLGDQATGVTTATGWNGAFDAIACNADLAHIYRDLLGPGRNGQKIISALRRRPLSPSAFTVHFGIKGDWQGIARNMVLFGPRFRGLLTDIFEHGVLPSDFLIFLNHISSGEKGLAPEGHSALSAIVPVAHLGKLPIDWTEMGAVYEKRILEEIGHRLIPDLSSRIVTSMHVTPQDIASRTNAWNGNMWGSQPSLRTPGWLHGLHQDRELKNLYFVGMGTAGSTGPSGMHGILCSARKVAQMMMGYDYG